MKRILSVIYFIILPCIVYSEVNSPNKILITLNEEIKYEINYFYNENGNLTMIKAIYPNKKEESIIFKYYKNKYLSEIIGENKHFNFTIKNNIIYCKMYFGNEADNTIYENKYVIDQTPNIFGFEFTIYNDYSNVISKLILNYDFKKRIFDTNVFNLNNVNIKNYSENKESIKLYDRNNLNETNYDFIILKEYAQDKISCYKYFDKNDQYIGKSIFTYNQNENINQKRYNENNENILNINIDYIQKKSNSYVNLF
jgi:hypothetical protein